MGLVGIILLVWGGGALLQVLLWEQQRRSHRAETVDAGWAATVALGAILAAVHSPGNVARALLLAVLVLLWSLRLIRHLWFDRVTSKNEDSRYRYLRQNWGHRAQFKFFVLYQAQALVAAILTISFWSALANAEPLGWLDLSAVLLIIAALGGESLADRQLAAFKQAAANSQAVCRNGMWRFTRHPNYFCEWLFWLSLPLLGWHSPYFGLTGLAPFLMYILLTRVTGIPPAEASSLRSRGEAYQRYQQECPAFFPGRPKELNHD